MSVLKASVRHVTSISSCHIAFLKFPVWEATGGSSEGNITRPGTIHDPNGPRRGNIDFTLSIPYTRRDHEEAMRNRIVRNTSLTNTTSHTHLPCYEEAIQERDTHLDGEAMPNLALSHGTQPVKLPNWRS